MSQEMTLSRADVKILRLSQQLLGVRLSQWDHETSPRLCRNHDKQREQLSNVIDLLQEEIDCLVMGELEYPEVQIFMPAGTTGPGDCPPH